MFAPPPSLFSRHFFCMESMDTPPISTTITDDEALQFVIMLSAGLPPEQAILYFTDETDPGAIATLLNKWLRSRAVKSAQRTLLGKNWQDMTLEERIDNGLNYHYNSLAYLLFSTSYLSVGPADKAKLDSARQALEAKKAGTAGQGDALSRFMDDFRSGKLAKVLPSIKAN
jgi:hypothetical protein